MTYSFSPSLRKPDYFFSSTLICNIMDLHRDVAKLTCIILLQLVVLAGKKQILKNYFNHSWKSSFGTGHSHSLTLKLNFATSHSDHVVNLLYALRLQAFSFELAFEVLWLYVAFLIHSYYYGRRPYLDKSYLCQF